jgi:hypothetical protein
MDTGTMRIERRPSDGAVLVRVPSRGDDGFLPVDAVFAFRAGDPQYGFWEQRLREQEIEKG